MTESEILQAIHRPVGAKTLDAVKRRVRAGMGRCQSGFCSPHVIEILARELGIPEEEVRKRGEKAYVLDKGRFSEEYVNVTGNNNWYIITDLV